MLWAGVRDLAPVPGMDGLAAQGFNLSEAHYIGPGMQFLIGEMNGNLFSKKESFVDAFYHVKDGQSGHAG